MKVAQNEVMNAIFVSRFHILDKFIIYFEFSKFRVEKLQMVELLIKRSNSDTLKLKLLEMMY